MNAPPLRGSVIGCGWIGAQVAGDPKADGIQSHAGAYAACDETNLVALCDPDSSRLKTAGARWPSAALYGNIEEMLAATAPEIVSVCTPDETHAAVLRTVLNASSVRAVVMEKPLATNVRESIELVSDAERRGIRLVMNYSRRYAESHQLVKQAIDAGAIGKVQAVQGVYTKGIMHNGTHWIDLARWLIGEIVEVDGWGSDVGGDPTCHARFRFADGAAGTLIGADASHFTVFEMDILGSAGRVRLADSGNTIEWWTVGESARYSGYRTLQPAAGGMAGFRDVALHVVANAVRVVRQGEPPICSGRDGAAALVVADAIIRALRSGQPSRVSF